MQPFGMRSRSANFPGDPLFEVLNASLVHSFYHPGDGCASLSLAIHPLKDVWDFTPLGRMPKASLCNRWVSGNRIQFFKNLCVLRGSSVLLKKRRYKSTLTSNPSPSDTP